MKIRRRAIRGEPCDDLPGRFGTHYLALSRMIPLAWE